ncbi:MAG: short-chain dehydrogenase [Rhodospirillales bacterium 20-64-7]|nr:MAG: short-chain dehydrogenase [Rhodospirillales bacterium 20-64-7]
MSEGNGAKSALVIGASRGLGLGLSLELLKRGWNVTATVRSAAGGTGLEDYYQQVTMDTLDINNTSMVNAFVHRMNGKFFDVVLVNAGIGGPEGKTVETVTPEDMTHLVMTNSVAPVRLAYRLLPMVRPETGILAFMSSILGSVTLTSGWSPLYSASKAALNSLTRSLVSELKEQKLTVLTLHPGWVRTDMGGPNADIDVETSVTGLADVLQAKAGAGGHEFLDYRGTTLPW